MQRTPQREAAYNAFDSERAYQFDRWGDNPLTIGEFILLAEEYLAQARRIWSTEVKPERESLEFMRKVGGIATNCLEQHGAPPRAGYESGRRDATIG